MRKLTAQVGDEFGIWRISEVSNTIGVAIVNCKNCGIEKRKTLLQLQRAKKIMKYGCQNCSNLHKGEAGLRTLLLIYKTSAKKQERKFLLTIEEFKILTTSSCHYCGSQPTLIKCTNPYNENRKSHWGDYAYNGIDRVDNNEGYTLENCITCCYICNRAKNNMSYNEFINYTKRIYNYLTTKDNNNVRQKNTQIEQRQGEKR